MTVSGLDAATLAIAIGGLLLGVRSAWRDYARDRVRVRVIPKLAYPVGPIPDRRPRLAFEIINDSTFPVTVDEVGFLYHGTKMRGAMAVPIVPNGEKWPHRLEPLSAITVYSLPEYLLETVRRPVKSAYVSTTTGRVIPGTSKILKAMVETHEVPTYPRTLSSTGTPGFVTIAELE